MAGVLIHRHSSKEQRQKYPKASLHNTMNKNINKLLITFLLLIVVTNVSALDILKPATFNESYTIIQVCATCTFINITVSTSAGIIESNVEMTNNGSGNWIYTITPAVTSRHDVTGVGDKDGANSAFATYFDVTPSGKVVSTGDSMLYSLFAFVSLVWICLLSFFILIMPGSNEKDDGGFETKVIRIKYFRVLLIFFLWPSLIILLNFLNGIATNFTALSMFAGTLGFLFETMMRLTWPFTVIIIAWIVVMLVHDTNINRQLDKFDKFDPIGGNPNGRF